MKSKQNAKTNIALQTTLDTLDYSWNITSQIAHINALILLGYLQTAQWVLLFQTTHGNVVNFCIFVNSALSPSHFNEDNTIDHGQHRIKTGSACYLMSVKIH